MIVNTRTGKLTLTKTEKDCLNKAFKILVGVNKHGDGKLAECADQASYHIEGVLHELAENAEVTA